jgi:HK97 family phage portal protein
MFLATDVGGFDTSGRGPYDDFWYGPIPGKTTAGVRINDDTAMRLAVLYACIMVISQDLAKVPLMMFRRTANGGRVRVTDHPIIQLLRQPTRSMNGVDWKQRLQAHQLLRGNGYCEIRTDFRGRVVQLPPWKPDNVRVEVMRDESLRYHVRDPQLGSEKIYVEGEVLHMRGLSLDGPLGLSPIDQMKECLGEGVAAQAYASSFFANDARPGMWLKHPSNFKDETQRKDWVNAFKRAFGGGGRFSPIMLEYGIELNELPMVNHADLQFLELRKLKANEICAIFRVPPHKVAILDRSTNNNIEHQGIEYVTDCLLTWCRRWEEVLSQNLLTEAEREELYFEFMLDALMRGDTKSRYEAYTQAAAAGGWMTRNEIRRKENLDPLDHLDEPLEPVNMVPAGTQKADTTDTPSPPDKGDPGTDDAQQDARATTLELQARRRVLNRETRALSKEWERAGGDIEAFQEAATSFYAFHLPFVAQALVIELPRAQAYCVAQCDEIDRAIAASAVPAMLASWEADAQALQFSPLPAAQPPKE